MPSITNSVNSLLGRGGNFEKLGKAVGVDKDKAELAVGAATPEIVRGLAAKSDGKGGVKSVNAIIDASDSAILENPGNLFGSEKSEEGAATLDEIFGSDRSALLEGLVSKTGLAEGIIGKVLPLLAPVVLAVIGERKTGENLDQEGLVTLLAAEKSSLEKDGSLFGSVAKGSAAASVASTAGFAAAKKVRTKSAKSINSTNESVKGKAESMSEKAKGKAESLKDKAAAAKEKAAEVREEAKGKAATAKDKAGDAMKTAKGKAEDATGKAGDSAAAAKDKARGATGKVSDATGKAGDSAAAAKDKARDATGKVSDAEDAAKDSAGNLRDKAADSAAVAKDKAKSIEGKAGNAKSTAKERATSAKGTARDSASNQVTNVAKSAGGAKKAVQGSAAAAMGKADGVKGKASAAKKRAVAESKNQTGSAKSAVSGISAAGSKAAKGKSGSVKSAAGSTKGRAGAAKDKAGAAADKVGATTKSKKIEAPANRKGKSWIVYALGLLAAIVALGLLASQCSSDDEGAVSSGTEVAESNGLQSSVDAELPDGVEASVDGDSVVLTGEVASADEAAALVSKVESVQGVGSVDDQLTISEPDVESDPASDLQSAVDAALPTGIIGTLDGDTVTLSGEVPSEDEAATLVSKVESVQGVGSVDNQLTIANAAGETSLGDELDLGNITFDYTSAQLTAEGQAVVAKWTNYLEENADVKVQIVGHTDSDGEEADNLDLSQRRAATVKAALEASGIAADRMETDGKGESEPKVDNDTEPNKAINRRIEFIDQSSN